MKKSLVFALLGTALLAAGLYFSRPDHLHAQPATARYVPLGVATGLNGLHSVAWYLDVTANKVVMCSSTNPPSCYTTQIP